MIINNYIGIINTKSNRIRLDEDISSNSEIPSYYLEDSESEDDGKQYEYQWSPEKEKERQIDASNALKKQMIDALLKDAVLSANEPFTFCHEPNDILNELFCEDYFESLKEHNKLYPAQPLVWRYISIATSTILIGNTEYYPHLLYLPPIISMIRVKLWCVSYPLNIRLICIESIF